MRNPFFIYPKNVSTLRISDNIYKTLNNPKNGVYLQFVDDLLFVISVDGVLSECLVFDGELLVDGFVMKRTNLKYKGKTVEEYLCENF